MNKKDAEAAAKTRKPTYEELRGALRLAVAVYTFFGPHNTYELKVTNKVRADIERILGLSYEQKNTKA